MKYLLLFMQQQQKRSVEENDYKLERIVGFMQNNRYTRASRGIAHVSLIELY